MTGTADPDTARRPRPAPHRLGLVLAAGLVVATIALLPWVARSIATELLSRQDRELYDFVTGELLPATPPELEAAAPNYITVGVLDIAPSTNQIDLAISGNRICPGDCPEILVRLYALDDNASQRRGVPPLQTVVIPSDELMFSQRVSLPVRGMPNLYPLDTYELLLGLSINLVWSNGEVTEVTPADFEVGAMATLQNLDDALLMGAPEPVAPNEVRAPTDPYGFVAVQRLRFNQPDYLVVLALLLVLLISMSGVIAMTTRNYQDLVVGVGGIVLGVWGVRSVLSQSASPGPNLLDLSLSVVILLLLTTFLVRSVLYFHARAQLPTFPAVRRDEGKRSDRNRG
jgi:hypothetical protein